MCVCVYIYYIPDKTVYMCTYDNGRLALSQSIMVV